jgi:homoserine acetyltransferase
MNDPAWKDGNYDAPPEKGVRLWRDILNLLAARTPDMYQAQFKNGMDALPWMKEQEDATMKAFDPTLTVSGHIVGVAGSRTLMISVCYALRAASSSEIA